MHGEIERAVLSITMEETSAKREGRFRILRDKSFIQPDTLSPLPCRAECLNAIVRRVAAEITTKALLIVLHADPSPCVATINRMDPEHLCFFIPETVRPKIETLVQPNLLKLPKKWDWLITPDPHGFGACYKTINQPLADLLKA